jgi:diacylglycerol kinase family enzyme
MKYFLIMNPGSHSGRSRRRFQRLQQMLQAAAIDHDSGETRNMGDARRLSRMANEKEYEGVIAVGGDGTINGVINGFFDEEGNRISRARFGVIYTGTSPDFCKSYGIPLRHEEAVERLNEPKTIRIPVGRIRLQVREPSEENANEGREVVRYFGCCANIGLGAELARRANGGIRKYLGDFAGTLVSLLVSLKNYKVGTQTCIIDGKMKEIPRMLNMSIGLTRHIASGIKMPIERNEEMDGFYLMTVKNLTPGSVIPLLWKVYSGRPFTNGSYLDVAWGRKVIFDGKASDMEVEFDGDPAGYLPCSIGLAKEPLDLIV